MSAKLKAANRYAGETFPFLSAALAEDLDSEAPSADALEWLEAATSEAEADPRPRLTSDELGQRLRARHEARLRRGAL